MSREDRTRAAARRTNPVHAWIHAKRETMETLAARAHVSLRTVERVAAGLRPSRAVAEKLARATGDRVEAYMRLDPQPRERRRRRPRRGRESGFSPARGATSGNPVRVAHKISPASTERKRRNPNAPVSQKRDSSPRLERVLSSEVMAGNATPEHAAPRNESRKTLRINLDGETARRLGHIAVDRSTTVHELILQAVRDGLDRDLWGEP